VLEYLVVHDQEAIVDVEVGADFLYLGEKDISTQDQISELDSELEERNFPDEPIKRGEAL
jgi:hypothetical protein